MGKSKKGRQGFAEKQNLADQIIDGRVVKGKSKNKIRLRKDDDEIVRRSNGSLNLTNFKTRFSLTNI